MEPILTKPSENNVVIDLRYGRLKQITSKLFPQLSDTVLEELQLKYKWLALERGQVLCRQGEAGDSLYILVTGRLKAVVNLGLANEREVGETSQGESVGEMSLITGEPRTATIVALRSSTLVQLQKADFEELVMLHPEVLMSLSKLTINRLNYTMHHTKVPAQTTNIALVPASGSMVTKELIQQLLSSLGKECRAHYLHKDLIPTELLLKMENPAKAQEALSQWLIEQEAEQRFLVYEAEPENTLWTQLCLRHADKIIVIKEAEAGLELSEIEKTVFQQSNKLHTQTRELVVLYPENTERPTHTHQLLKERPVKRHYNIRLGDTKHIDRLARMVVDKGIGLVLGGGGAKAFAHIGIFRALQETGVPIDMVCGTSMGAIIAAAVAHEWAPEEFYKKGRSAFVTDKPLNDYTLPIISLIKGHKLQHINRKYFGDYHIEDLWLNFFCISSNYTLSRMEVHERGPLWKAVTASASIPGVLPPVVDGNNLLVDGASFNNFPVDIMKAKYGGKLIGINLLIDKEYTLDYDNLPGGWHMFFSRFLPFLKRYRSPSIAAIMLKSTILSSIEHQRKQADDLQLHMTPPVSNFSLMDLKNFDRIVATGYDYGKDYLQNLETTQLESIKAPKANLEV